MRLTIFCDNMDITIFRFGHRIDRDKRTTTHCALVSRAFGCNKIYYCGQEDNHFEKSVKDICKQWGGEFPVEYKKNYLDFLEKNKSKYYIIHLTMYGLDLKEFLKQKPKLEKDKKPILIIIGSQKVPTEIYNLADVNLSITNQPHSEVAALGILLHELNDYSKIEFPDQKRIITPNAKCKSVKKN